MRHWLRLALACLACTPSLVHAEGYDVPSAKLPAHVERSDADGVAHLVISLTVPPVMEAIPRYSRLFGYGWIGEGQGAHRLPVHQCPTADSCPVGFPLASGEYQPGQQLTYTVDLPVAFVTAPHAHFHLGLGGDNTPYFPTANLLARP